MQRYRGANADDSHSRYVTSEMGTATTQSAAGAAKGAAVQRRGAERRGAEVQCRGGARMTASATATIATRSQRCDAEAVQRWSGRR